jgi:hypothetical protein
LTASHSSLETESFTAHLAGVSIRRGGRIERPSLVDIFHTAVRVFITTSAKTITAGEARLTMRVVLNTLTAFTVERVRREAVFIPGPERCAPQAAEDSADAALVEAAVGSTAVAVAGSMAAVAAGSTAVAAEVTAAK